jgi:alkylhydroperoxidase family enzyme
VKAYGNEAKVTATLDNLDTAPIEEPLRATLRMLRKLTKEHAVTPDDMRTLLAAGVSKQQILDTLEVAFAFNVIDRLADTFKFAIQTPKGFASDAKFLMSKGYDS